jgi:hypothetical protein
MLYIFLLVLLTIIPIIAVYLYNYFGLNILLGIKLGQIISKEEFEFFKEMVLKAASDGKITKEERAKIIHAIKSKFRSVELYMLEKYAPLVYKYILKRIEK